jgi:hypothetical protein
MKRNPVDVLNDMHKAGFATDDAVKKLDARRQYRQPYKQSLRKTEQATMSEKPTIDKFLFDLVETLDNLPYAKEHIDSHREDQITVSCQEGSVFLKVERQP